MRCRHSGQSLVELGLLAPILIVLLVIVLDLGRLLVLWVVVTNAAREGAYTAAGQVAGSVTDQAVRDAVAGENGALAFVTADPTHVSIAYPSPNIVLVTARSPFQPISPLASSLWGGNSPWVSASAAFPLLLPTPSPLPITPSTPLPSPTPTTAATRTPTRTPTSAATATRTPTPGNTAVLTATPTRSTTPTPSPTPGPCSTTTSIPPLAGNRGYYVTLTTGGSGTISATWTLPAKNNIRIAIYAGNPLSGDPNPSSTTPPTGSVATGSINDIALTVTSPSEPAGSYTVYFYNQGSVIGTNSTGSITYVKATCP